MKIRNLLSICAVTAVLAPCASSASIVYRMVGGMSDPFGGFPGNPVQAEIVFSDAYVEGTSFFSDYGDLVSVVESFYMNYGWWTDYYGPGPYSGTIYGSMSPNGGSIWFNCSYYNACGVRISDGTWEQWDWPSTPRTGTFVRWERIPEPPTLALSLAAILALLQFGRRPARALAGAA